MGRPCSVCAHPDRDEIDKALVGGETYRIVANRYKPVSVPAIQRHQVSHLSPGLRKLSADQELNRNGDLLDQLRNLIGRVYGVLDAAMQSGDPKMVLAAVRDAKSLLELQAKLTGELDERPQTLVVNLASTSEWTDARTRIVHALAPFPEARRAVLTALGGGDFDVIDEQPVAAIAG